MGILLKVTVAGVLAVVAQYAFNIYTTWGGCGHNHSHHPGVCQAVKGVDFGSEDFEILSDGMAFVTSGLRYTWMSPKCQFYWRRHEVQGRIFLLDMGRLHQGARPLPIAPSEDFDPLTFAPHGLSVWEDKQQGRHVVFVVNHPFQDRAPDRVEKFVFDPDKQQLLHTASYSNVSLTGVNDVQATGEDSFYFTNSAFFMDPTLKMLEMVLQLPLANVVHYQNKVYTRVASGLKGPNGVVMSPDGRHVYVAIFSSQEILVFQRNKDSSLVLLQTFRLYTSWPDNLQIDPKTGDMYVGLHPRFLSFLAYVDDVGALTSPSQVLRLRLKNGLIASSQELLFDNGELISGSSTAAVYNGTLLVGSVWHKLLACTVQVPLL